MYNLSPYNQFENVKYIGKGGFGIIYKAIWLSKYKEIVLKSLSNLDENNLNEKLADFLNEWDCHEKCLNSNRIIDLHGFTKDPDTSQYMIVMDYADKGDLNRNLTKVIKNNWGQRLLMLYEIISGLNEIHRQNLIHCDFHHGNILNHGEKSRNQVFVGDLGLCRPVKSLKKGDIYGVIPFMAPEILRGKQYSQASDIYSFSMIMWEFTSGVPPFNDKAHDLQLSLDICKGERPEIIENTPQCYIDLMKKCWDEDPLKRPSASEVENIIKNWIYRPSSNEINDELKSNIMEFINAPIVNNDLTAELHPQACYISRLHDFTNEELNEILDESSEKLDEIVESECLNYTVIP
ncbi:hypothetical protein RclHR1_04850014 [Rhizophagus clarus]|uniref:Protein kinase domain-containing protein n=1 Tax=Rhizophagus clarus TaxID=94130 RepID=A0A2Z6RJJ8_9GLOM|nr:hypothetical protein RclHR1_04850014 [Rhizophagus clarus]